MDEAQLARRMEAENRRVERVHAVRAPLRDFKVGVEERVDEFFPELEALEEKGVGVINWAKNLWKNVTEANGMEGHKRMGEIAVILDDSPMEERPGVALVANIYVGYGNMSFRYMTVDERHAETIRDTGIIGDWRWGKMVTREDFSLAKNLDPRSTANRLRSGLKFSLARDEKLTFGKGIIAESRRSLRMYQDAAIVASNFPEMELERMKDRVSAAEQSMELVQKAAENPELNPFIASVLDKAKTESEPKPETQKATN